MAINIRDVREQELDAVLALNNGAGPGILPLDSVSLREHFDSAAYFRVADVDGHLAGFLIAHTADADYQSPNFCWFRDCYPSFLYIDRIVVASTRRGAGVGRIFYADISSFAEVRVPLLACEVFLEPRNDVAVLFHGTYGFLEVGQQVMSNVNRRVSLLAKDMCSYPFVRDQYLAQAGLPAVAWLAGRERVVAVRNQATGT